MCSFYMTSKNRESFTTSTKPALGVQEEEGVQLRRTHFKTTAFCKNLRVKQRSSAQEFVHEYVMNVINIPVECHFFSYSQCEYESSGQEGYSHQAERHLSRRLSGEEREKSFSLGTKLSLFKPVRTAGPGVCRSSLIHITKIFMVDLLE